MCLAQDHLMFLTLPIMSMPDCTLYPTQMLILLPLYVMLSILILVCAATSFFCVLFGECPSLCTIRHSSNRTSVSSGKWQSWVSREPGAFDVCRPACRDSMLYIICIGGSFPWGCSVIPGIRILRHFLSPHCSRWLGYSLQPPPVFTMFIIRPICLLSSEIFCNSSCLHVHTNISSAKGDKYVFTSKSVNSSWYIFRCHSWQILPYVHNFVFWDAWVFYTFRVQRGLFFPNCFISCFQCINVNLIFSRFVPTLNFPQRFFYFPCHYWWCLYYYDLSRSYNFE